MATVQTFRLRKADSEMAEQNEVKTLKLDKRFITPLLTGEKRVTRRRTENHYERSRVAPEVWYYRKLFQKDTWLEISDEEACLIPRGTELLITTSEQRVTEHAPVRPGETILFTEPLPGGKYAPRRHGNSDTCPPRIHSGHIRSRSQKRGLCFR